MARTSGYRSVLLLVVLIYAELVLGFTDLHRYLAYDEAIYLSQIYPGPALPFTAPRARGLPVLLAPMGLIDAPVPVVRSYLLVLEAGLMYVAFNAWLPVLRGRAVVAAAAFGVCWLPLFYATEVFPNLPVAFGTVTAAGYLARYLVGASGRRALVAAAVAVAAVSVIRPTEAAFVTLGLGLIAVTGRGRELAWRWGLLLAGLAVGWLPWLIEAQARFGGPLNRLREAATNVGGGFHPDNLRRQLSLTDGPVSGSGPAGPLPGPGVAWWAGLVVAVVVLLFRVLRGRADRVQRAGAVAAAVGVATATQYLFLTQVREARFLLPAYATLTVALVAAVPARLGRRRRLGRHEDHQLEPHRLELFGRTVPLTGVLLASVLFLAFAGWQLSVTRQVDADQGQARQLGQRLVRAVHRQTVTPCVVAAAVNFPVIAFGTGCRGAPFEPDSPDITVAVDGSDGSRALPPVYVLTSTDPARTGVRPVPGSVRPLAVDGVPGWWLFVAAPDEVFPSP